MYPILIDLDAINYDYSVSMLKMYFKLLKVLELK